jgi:hypothetical protein
MSKSSKKFYLRSEVTKALVDSWVKETGSVANAAKKYCSQIGGSKVPGQPSSYNAARHFLHDVVEGGNIGPGIIRSVTEEQALNRVRELLSAANIPIEEVGRIDKVHLKSEAVNVRQADGSSILTPRYKTSLSLSPKWAEGPKWPMIEQGPVLNIQYAPRVESVSGAKLKVFGWMDTQIWYYRNIETMELTPFHDVDAINIGLEALRLYQPDIVVIDGDLIDMASHSKYLQLPEFQLTYQPSINFTTRLLGTIRSIVGKKCKIVYVPGNHERRAAEYAAIYAKANYGIKRGTFENELPDTWPVQSLPYLLRLEELNIEYMHEYPGGEYWVNPGIVFTHQPEKNKDLRATLIHGHEESGEMKSHSVHTNEGIKVYRRYCVPGFGRQDNTKDKTLLNSTSVASNRAKKSGNQAFCTIDIVRDDMFQVLVHDIINGECSFYGKHLQAKKK